MEMDLNGGDTSDENIQPAPDNSTDEIKKKYQDARNYKAKRIRSARHYLRIAQSLGAGEGSASLGKYTREIETWRNLPLEKVDELIKKWSSVTPC